MKLRQILFRILCGFLLGISVVGPGISGSVMAVMLGIYDKLIAITANPFKKMRETITYLFPMGIGAGISFVLYIYLFSILLERFATPTYFLFIALILGSMPAIYKKATAGTVRRVHVAVCIAAFFIAAALGLVGRSSFEFVRDVENVFYLSLSGLIAGAVSAIPGVSVSVVLMLLGVFEVLFAKAKALDIWTMAPVAVCFLIGLVLFSNLIKRVFERRRALGFFAVLGFMAGSIVGIVPNPPSGGVEWALSILLFAVGLALSIAFARLARVLNTAEPADR